MPAIHDGRAEGFDRDRIILLVDDYDPFIQDSALMPGQLSGKFCGTVHVETVHDTEDDNRQGRIVMDNVLVAEAVRVFLGNKVG